MDTIELEQFIINNWALTIKGSKSSLDSDDQEMVETFKTWESVTEWFLRDAPPSLILTRPALGHLHVFVEFFQGNIVPGVDISYLWGSLVCLLQLISKNLRALDQVPRMIKSLALKAGAFNSYCTRDYVVTNTIKEVCFDIQLQFVDFVTASIKHIRAAECGLQGYSSTDKGIGPQQRIQRRYEMATLELGEALSRLEKPNPEKYASVDMVMRSQEPKQRCIIIPPTRTNHLFDRVDVFVKLDELLTPDAGDFSLQSVALYGVGGVGKTSIASSYASKKFSDQVYDVVLWVYGEKDASLRQSFTDIAMRLKLPGAQPQTHDKNQILVQDWFQITECKWLVIFDNVESANILAPYWPRISRKGRAIITTRNHSLSFDPAASGLEITSWDAETGADFLLFLLKKSIGRDLNAESASARTLSERLSGHALALSQMAGLVHDGEYSIQDFTTMYLENPRSAHSIDELAALWDLAFQSLDKNSFSLLGIISFLMPDNIQPEILEPRNHQDLPPDLEFLKEKFTGFSAAIRKLKTRALIKRDRDSGILTVHRLVQTQFRYFLGPTDCQRFFNDTVKLVSYVVPESEMEKGQLFEKWEGLNRYLQHVINLRDIFEEERKTSQSFKAPREFCVILNDYQRFLYEQCAFEECERTCAVNRVAISALASKEDKINLEGTIISHQAQVIEKLGNPHKAIGICQQEIDIRLAELPRKQMILSFSSCNLGIIYSSANNWVKASEAFQQSHHWWAAHFASKGESQDYAPVMAISEARCLIGLGKLSRAREMLDPILSMVGDEDNMNFGSFAYAHFCIGILDRCEHEFESAEEHFIEAQNAWMRGDNNRLHPFNAGILYKIGACCLDQGKVEASIKHIRDSLEVTEFYSRMIPVEHGRNLFKLSEALLQNRDSNAAEAADLREKAGTYLKKKKPDAIESGTEKAYDDLIPVYWR